MTETVAEAMAAELAAAGIDRVFGLPGGEIVPLIDACRRRDIAFQLCRHEADAGLMAAVYGRLVNRPGVVLTTLGPGASNLLLPIGNSLLDREPLVAISAQVPDTWPAHRI
ncbi:MAG: thiamine pyrophosphate-binding protein, partial [Candidatus Dormiibacterota bacterium]